MRDKVCDKFSDEPSEDVVESFNRLRQTGSVDEFLEKFEIMKAQMLIRNPALNDSHFLSSFIGFLRDDIKMTVKLFKNPTLKVAIEKERMQEKALEAIEKKGKAHSKSTSTWNTTSAPKPSTSLVPARSSQLKPVTYRVSKEVYDYRRVNPLCYKCSEKYEPGCLCKYNQLNYIIVETGEVIGDQDEPVLEVPELEGRNEIEPAM